jgi:hypothetical protein
MAVTQLIEGGIRPIGTPAYCSSCLGQYPERRHVEFPASVDRGFGPEMEDGMRINYDDLILCEDCIREGGAFVGLVPEGEAEQECKRLRKMLAEEKLNREVAERYANRMEEAIANRPEPIHVARPRGKPRG